jgi:hypothetical protein
MHFLSGSNIPFLIQDYHKVPSAKQSGWMVKSKELFPHSQNLPMQHLSLIQFLLPNMDKCHVVQADLYVIRLWSKQLLFPSQHLLESLLCPSKIPLSILKDCEIVQSHERIWMLSS